MAMMRVMTKACKRKGVEYPSTPTEYIVDIVKNKSITIYREKNGVVEQGRTFRMGDEAEYDSYNLHYTGIIDGISEKVVSIVKTRGAIKHKLNMNEFCWRNFKFDAAETERKNHEEMMHQ